MSPEERYAVDQFLSGVFHEDWGDEFGSIESSVDWYCRNSSRGRLELVATGIKKLLEESGGEAGLQRFLFETLRLHFDPRGLGMSCTDWLSFMHDHIVRSLEEHGDDSGSPDEQRNLP